MEIVTWIVITLLTVVASIRTYAEYSRARKQYEKENEDVFQKYLNRSK